MFKIKFLLILLASLPCILKAQVIFEYSDTSNFVFSYVPFERNANNKVLNQLALAHLKVPEKTSFNYQLRHRISVSYRQSDSLFILLDVKPLTITGDIQLKDYNLEKLLVPSAYKVHISVSNPQSGEILKSDKLVVMDDGMTTVGTFADSLWNDGTDVKVEILGISFTEQDYNKMVLELNSIRDYYASSLMADTLIRKIQKARKNSTSLEDIVKTYVTAVKGLYLIEESMEVTSDIVPGKDPLKIGQKLPLLRYNLKEYNEYVSQSGKELLKGNVYDAFADAYIKSLKEAGALSRSVDYYSSPFFYKLYSNSITSWQLRSAYTLFESELKARGIANFDINRLTHEILKGYLKESALLISANRYVEAVDLLSGAAKLKNLSPYDHLSGNIEAALTEARKGLVNSYIAIMQKALDKNLITLAEKYLLEVENYIEKYNITETESLSFRDIYLKIAGVQIQFGYNSLAKGDNLIALNEFEKAIDLLKSYESVHKEKAENGKIMALSAIFNEKLADIENCISAGDHVNARIKLKEAVDFVTEYKSFYPDKSRISEVEYKIEEIKYNEILSYCSSDINNESSLVFYLAEAVELQKKYQFNNIEILDTLTDRIGIKYLNEQFSLARLNFWASKPDTAMVIATAAYNLANQLNRQNYPSIKEQYSKITELAKESWCNEVKSEFNSLINKSESLFKANKLNEAIIKANEAKEYAFKSSACGVKTIEVNKLLDKYRHLIRWNELVNNAYIRLNINEYFEAGNLIRQAESVYSYYQLDTIGIANIGYFDFAIESNDLQLIVYAISHLSNLGKFDQSMILLDKLRLKGYNETDAENLQESLARNLALRDIKETPDLNVKIMIESYTKGDDWYTRFENVYRYHTGNSK